LSLLVTHVGSLPRSQAVVDFLFALEPGEANDQPAFDACMARAVTDLVRRQKDAGIDILSDGKTSKFSFATYVKDRYDGFGCDSPCNAPADLKLYPSFLDRLAKQGGTPHDARPQCVGPVVSNGQGELPKDIAALKAAMAAQGETRGFMNAASPGVIALILQNANYPMR
jgi:5-methyltetrahydropteroyltriglutamate--homocysteine methyltransferase